MESSFSDSVNFFSFSKTLIVRVFYMKKCFRSCQVKYLIYLFLFVCCSSESNDSADVRHLSKHKGPVSCSN